jgi:hypothetical protein
MREYCRRLDLAPEVSYLETDKPENVRFYERHGYVVIDEADVIGVPNWFMIRQPHRSARDRRGTAAAEYGRAPGGYSHVDGLHGPSASSRARGRSRVPYPLGRVRCH